MSDPHSARLPESARGTGRRRFLRTMGIPAAALGVAMTTTAVTGRPAAAAEDDCTVHAVAFQDLRSVTAEPTDIYLVDDHGRAGAFVLDGTDTVSADNDGTVIVTATGQRLKRIVDSFQVDAGWFGATGDGQADDTQALQRAADAAAALVADQPLVAYPAGVSLLLPAVTAYRTTDTLAIDADINVYMGSAVLYDGPPDRAAVVVGRPGYANASVTMELAVVRSSANYATWANPDEVGLLLYCLNTATVRILQVRGFTVGLRAMGDSAGFGYNTVHLGLIIDNHIGVELSNRNSANVRGWVNENLWLGGRFGRFGGVGLGKDCIGVRITSEDGSYLNTNNNVFQKPSFELQQSRSDPGGEALPILIEHGRWNKFYDVRLEANGPVAIRVLNNAFENVVEAGYGEVGVDDRTGSATTIVLGASSRLTRGQVEVFRSGYLADQAMYHDGATRVVVPGVSFADPASSDVLIAGRATIAEKHLVLAPGASDGIGVFLDTVATKHYIVKSTAEAGHHGQLALACYDTDGQLMAAPAEGVPLIRPQAQFAAYWESGTIGGAYVITAEGNHARDVHFTVADEVAEVRLVLLAGTAALHLRSFAVVTADPGAPAARAGVPVATFGTFASEPPSTRQWPRGTFVANAAPEPSGRGRLRQQVIGWSKLTDGPSNEAGVDWVEVSALLP